MKMTTLLFLALASIGFAAPAPYPVAVNSRIQAAPGIQVYRANESTFRVSFTDGATASDLTNCTPFMQWATSNTAAQVSTASYSVVSSTNGVVDFTFAPSSVNYAPGRYIYEVGVLKSGTVSTYQQGTFTIQGSPSGAGAAAVNWTTRVDWNAITWTNAPNFGVGTDLVARALASTSLSYAVSASNLAASAQSTALAASNLASTAVQPSALLTSTVFRAFESGILKSDDGLRTLVTSNGVLYLTCVTFNTNGSVVVVSTSGDGYVGPSAGSTWSGFGSYNGAWYLSETEPLNQIYNFDTDQLYESTESRGILPAELLNPAGGNDKLSISYAQYVTNTYAIGDSSNFVLKSETNGWTVTPHTDLVTTNDSRTVKLTDLSFGNYLKSDSIGLSNSSPTITTYRMNVQGVFESTRLIELGVGPDSVGMLRASASAGVLKNFGMYLNAGDYTYSEFHNNLPTNSTDLRGQYASFEMRNGGSQATRVTHRMLMMYGATNDIQRGNYCDIPFDYNPYSTSVTFGAMSDGNGLNPPQTNPVHVRVSGSLTVAGALTLTNATGVFDGVLNGTNGLYFVPLGSTNRYWILGGN